MRPKLEKYRASVCILVIRVLVLIVCFGCQVSAFAEAPQKPKATYQKEFRALESETIGIIKQHFPASRELAELIERYDISDEPSTYVANFNAIGSYFELIFAPKLGDATSAQVEASKRVKELITKYDALQLEYAGIYKRLPSFDE